MLTGHTSLKYIYHALATPAQRPAYLTNTPTQQLCKTPSPDHIVAAWHICKCSFPCSDTIQFITINSHKVMYNIRLLKRKFFVAERLYRLHLPVFQTSITTYIAFTLSLIYNTIHRSNIHGISFFSYSYQLSQAPFYMHS